MAVRDYQPRGYTGNVIPETTYLARCLKVLEFHQWGRVGEPILYTTNG